MIIVTGAVGFIASRLILKLNQENFNAIVAVDNFDHPIKNKNLENCKIQERVDRDVFMDWLDYNYEEVEFIFHIVLKQIHPNLMWRCSQK